MTRQLSASPGQARAAATAPRESRGGVTPSNGAHGEPTARLRGDGSPRGEFAPELATMPLNGASVATMPLSNTASTGGLTARLAASAGVATTIIGVPSDRLKLEPEFMFAEPDEEVAAPAHRSPGAAFAMGATVQLQSDLLDSNPDETGPLDPLIVTPEPDDNATIAELRALVAADPNNPDALFKLSVQLHRAERIEAARATLGRLARVYQSLGQTAQATRIVEMLSAPQTGPIAPAPARTRRKAAATTVERTGTLRAAAVDELGGARAGMVKEPVMQRPPAFPAETLIFTNPLPDEERLPEPVREAIAQSSDDLAKGRLQAAFDACIWAIRLDASYHPAYLRLAEINTVQRQRRRARAQAESLIKVLKAAGEERHLWMAYRILIHTADSDLLSLRRLVELLIEAKQTDLASFYATKLIQLLDEEGLTEEATAYSVRLRSLIPGDTRAALEHVILLVKSGDVSTAIDLWEEAVAAGADPIVAKASLAAAVSATSDDEHWRLLADVGASLRERRDRDVLAAYQRTAGAMLPNALRRAGQGVLLACLDDLDARAILSDVVADRTAPAFTKSVAAVALSGLTRQHGTPEELAATIRSALRFLETPEIAAHPAWPGLVGFIPTYADFSIELANLLLGRQDAAGAVEVLNAAKGRGCVNEQICQTLADAYFRTGQLASALTVLDELAANLRSAGRLDTMAAVLRQMSQLAPNNIKVKTRLVETYLQRGFVAEARAELIQRADLEERSGLINDAAASLVRAAELYWTSGEPEESFQLYRRVITMQPQAVEHRHGLVAYYLQMNRRDEAAEQQRAIVDISLREGRRHEAIAALHQVIGLTPDDTSAYYQLGDLLAAVGEHGQAERVYRRIVALQPDDAIAQAKATSMAALKEQRAR